MMSFQNSKLNKKMETNAVLNKIKWKQDTKVEFVNKNTMNRVH